MSFLEGRAGDATIADGVPREVRLGRFSELLTNLAGDYAELMRHGHLYQASMQAGASLGTALTATAVTFTLYNPNGSAVIVALLECAVVFTTLPAVAAGNNVALVYAANDEPGAAIPATVTQLTIRNALLGQGIGSARAYSAATLPAVPVVVRVHPVGINNQTAVGMGQLAGKDLLNGAIGLQPNTAVTLQAIGTASSGIVSMVWAEIPR